MENTYAKFVRISLSIILAISIAAGLIVPLNASASESVSVWWPGDGVTVSGTQPLKAMVPGENVSEYEMFWQVDGGTWNWMDSNAQDYPHKEVSIDVGSWNWHGSGPYVINFIARKNGGVIAQQSVTIYVNNGLPRSSPTPAPKPAPAVQSNVQVQTQAATATAQTQIAAVQASAMLSSVSAPVATSSSAQVPATQSQSSQPTQLYVAGNSDAATQAAAWSSSDPAGAQAMQMLASQPTASWFGNWNGDVRNDVHTLVTAAQSSGKTPVLVAYDIPERDCGGFSSGGTNNPDAYRAWIQSFAAGIGNAPAIVILEPDALAEISCLSSSDQAVRLGLLSAAVTSLKSNSNTKVYIDAGHSNWVSAGTMAQELSSAGIAQADGFALNVSNFMPISDETAYGQSVSALIGNKHFVIDTSRNGNGSSGQWCNPSGAGIGMKPTFSTGNPLIDAYLWLKTPGESDGPCNGGPSAGVWWPSYALSLVRNAH